MAKTIGNGQGRPDYAAMYRAEVSRHAETKRRATLTDSERRELVALRTRAATTETRTHEYEALRRAAREFDAAREDLTCKVADTLHAASELDAARVECEALRERVALLESEVPGLRQDSIATEAEADRCRVRAEALERRIADTFRRLTRHLPAGWQGKTINTLMREVIPGRPNHVHLFAVAALDWCGEEAQRQAAPAALPDPNSPPLCPECCYREKCGERHKASVVGCPDFVRAPAVPDGRIVVVPGPAPSPGAMRAAEQMAAGAPVVVVAEGRRHPALSASELAGTFAEVEQRREIVVPPASDLLDMNDGADDECDEPDPADCGSCRGRIPDPCAGCKHLLDDPVNDPADLPPNGTVVRVVAEEPCPACRDLPAALRVACETCGGSATLPVLDFPGEQSATPEATP